MRGGRAKTGGGRRTGRPRARDAAGARSSTSPTCWARGRACCLTWGVEAVTKDHRLHRTAMLAPGIVAPLASRSCSARRGGAPRRSPYPATVANEPADTRSAGDYRRHRQASRPKEQHVARATRYDSEHLLHAGAAAAAGRQLVVRADGLVAEKAAGTGYGEAELAGARDLFRRGEYAKAEELFHYRRRTAHAPRAAIAGGPFYEAECLRLQGSTPRPPTPTTTCSTSTRTTPTATRPSSTCSTSPTTGSRTRARKWQESARRQRRQALVRLAALHLASTRPSRSSTSRAGPSRSWSRCRYNDINGPLADQALFLCGSVKLFNEDYADADCYFTRSTRHHQNSPLAPRPIELAIIAKHLSTGGPDTTAARPPRPASWWRRPSTTTPSWPATRRSATS